MDAVVFDFDGVLVDSEPVHWRGFARVLRERGIELTWDDYRERYLGFDDHDCFLAVCSDRGVAAGEEALARMIAAKTEVVRDELGASVAALPGAVALVESLAAEAVPIAVCSGALAPEIEIAARRVGVWRHLRTVVAAEDVQRGKPDPEGYALAVERLGALAGGPIRASMCVAVEDSPAGIAAAKAAGLHVLAVTTSYPETDLSEADTVVDSLAGASPATLRALVGS